MRRFSDRMSHHTLSELNVTPLLDLAFVLLIIFMITAPLMENSLDLVLPSSEANTSPVEPGAVQNVGVDRNGTIALNGEVTTLADLEAQLVALKAKNPDVAVVIRSDRDLPVQGLVHVLDAVQRAKVKRVGLVTTPEKQ
jgi:biopolymer transport protein ExbD